MRQDVGYFDLHVTSTAEVIESVSSDSLVIQDAISEKVSTFNSIQMSLHYLYFYELILLLKRCLDMHRSSNSICMCCFLLIDGAIFCTVTDNSFVSLGL